jgi:2'-5' RNA ligase
MWMQLDLGLDEPEQAVARPGRKPVRSRRPRKPAAPQPPIPGLEITRLDKLFFAIRVPCAVAPAIGGIRSELMSESGMKGTPISDDCLHISIHALGMYEGLPEDIKSQAIEAAERLRMPVFDVEFGRALSFANPRDNHPLVLRATEGLGSLYDFHHALGEEMRKAGLGRMVVKSFTPHVTMLYSSRILAERPVEPVGWRAQGFALIHSPYGASMHKPLQEWRFSDGTGSVPIVGGSL